MAIAVIHRSITQRRVFRNVLRGTSYPNVKYFASAADCMEELSPDQLDCAVVQKEILQKEHRLPGQQNDFKSFIASAPALVVSYQFSQEETVELVREGADELLLMPFAPETLYKKLAPLMGVSP